MNPGIVQIPSFLASLAWLIVELPFAVRVEDGTPVPIEALHIAHFTGGCASIAENKNLPVTLALTKCLMHAKICTQGINCLHQLLAKIIHYDVTVLYTTHSLFGDGY